MALKLDILANTRQLVSEMKKGGRSVEDLSDSLDDLAREGGGAADKLEAGFRELARSGTKSTGQVKKGLDDLKDEASQSGREAAASFSGEWTDVGDFVQETVANGLAGLGPLGVAAGIAAAAGIGVLTDTILGQQQAADELKERLSAAYRTAAEEGRAYLDTAQLIAEASDLMYDKERADEWRQVQEDAKQLGLDVFDVIAANAGETNKQREVQERINALLAEEKATHEDTDSVVGNLGQSVLGLETRWRAVIAATEEEQARAETLAEVTKQAEEENRQQIERTRQASQTRYEELAQQWANPIKGSIEVSVVDRTRESVDRIVNRINGRVASITISGRTGRQMLQ